MERTTEPEEACVVNRAVRDALRDGQAAYEARGILVVADLAARGRLDADDRALYQAVYTIFRGLPARLTRGAVLYLGTRDRAGGDVELAWEAREEPGHAPEPNSTPAETLRHGPHGDLLELALVGLDAICRARAGLHETPEPAAAPRTTSYLAEAMSGKVRRRFTFLIPARARDPRGAY